MLSAAVLLLLAPLKNLVIHACMESFKRHGYTPFIGVMLDIAYKPYFSTRLLQVYTAVAYAFMFWSIVMQMDLMVKAQAIYASCSRRVASKEDMLSSPCNGST